MRGGVLGTGMVGRTIATRGIEMYLALWLRLRGTTGHNIRVVAQT